MSKPILVANWKNYPSGKEEAQKILKELFRRPQVYKKLALLVAPPAPYLDLVSSRSGKVFHPASQDFSLADKGSHTGEISAEILKSFGVRAAIIGHSERRAMGESDEAVSEKARKALKAGIAPIVCIGESHRDHEGEYFEFLRTQIKRSLNGISKNAAAKVILAYEPLWAIGKGAREALRPADLEETVIFIRKILSDLFGRGVADKIPVIYGGSVEPRNAFALGNVPGVRGFLVGHASLNPKHFQIIAEALV